MSTAEMYGPTAIATPANAITVGRLLLTPVLLAAIVSGHVGSEHGGWGIVVAWFVISCTDGVDGLLARRMGTTRSGAFLDPLADKVCVLGAMAALVAVGAFWWLPVALIASREVAMSGYRSFVGRQGVSIPARRSAKVKAVMQDLAVGAALLPVSTGNRPFVLTLLWMAVALTLLTGLQYLHDGRRAGLIREATIRASSSSLSAR